MPLRSLSVAISVLGLLFVAACGGSSSGGTTTDTGGGEPDAQPSLEVSADTPGPDPACTRDEDCAGKLLDLGPCEIARCEGEPGRCVAVSAPSGTDCDDGDRCTTEDLCAEGECVGVARVCDDGDPCNGVESCDAATGECVASGAPVACDDGDPCNGLEFCDPETGDCVAGTPVLCDDGDPCNGVESCDQTTGDCVAGTPLVCDDGDACNGLESCEAGVGCQAGTAVLCDDGDPCNGVESCDPTTGDCVAGTPLVCDDGDACNGQESCEAGVGCQTGTPVVCGDDDPCNGEESCDAATGDCVAGTPLVCDDGDACNGLETCEAGVGCQAGTPVVCDDADPCNGAESCDAATGDCVAGTPLVCDDGDACNGLETCEAGVGCQAGVPLDCDDGNDCTADSCDPLTGCANVQDNMLPCDDGNPCTEGDHCVGGRCIYDSFVCVEDCRDGVDNDLDGMTDCDDSQCAFTPDCMPQVRFVDEPPAVTLAGYPFSPPVVAELVDTEGARITDDDRLVSLVMSQSAGANLLQIRGCGGETPSPNCWVSRDVLDADTPQRIESFTAVMRERRVTAVAYDPELRRLFAADALSGDLLNIDASTGGFWVQAAGTLPSNMRGFAFLGGSFYGVAESDDELYAIDKSTGIASVLGTLSVDGPGPVIGGFVGLASDPSTDSLFALARVSGSLTLCLIDPAALTLTPLQNLEDAEPGLSGMTILPDGRFMVVGGAAAALPGAVHELDPATGALTQLFAASHVSDGIEQLTWIPGYLGGEWTVTSVDGVATFDEAWLSAAGEGYVIAAAAAGHLSDDSAPFDVRDDSARRVVFAQQPAESLVNRTMARVTVELRDSLDRPFQGNDILIEMSLEGQGAGLLHSRGCEPETGGCALRFDLLDALTPQRVASLDSGETERRLVALAYNPEDGLVYGRDELGFDLVVVDPATGATELRANSRLANTGRAFAFRAGALLAGGAWSGSLYAVDPVSGTETLLNDLSAAGGGLVGPLQAMAWHAMSDQLWALAPVGGRLQLGLVDTAAMIFTSAMDLQDDEPGLTGLAVLPDGALIALAGPTAAEPGALYGLDPAAATVTRLMGPADAAAGEGQITWVPGQLLGTTEAWQNLLGQAHFDNLRVSAPGEGYRLEAHTPGFLPATSEPFTVLDDGDRYLDFGTAPSDATYPDWLSPNVAVLLRDSFGGNLSLTGTLVTASLEVNPGFEVIQLHGCDESSGSYCIPQVDRVEPVLADRRLAGNLYAGLIPTAMAYNPADGMVYFRDHREAALARLDPRTLAVEILASGGLVTPTRAMAFRDGELFGVAETGGALFSVDLDTGAEEPLGALTVSTGAEVDVVRGGAPQPTGDGIFVLVEMVGSDFLWVAAVDHRTATLTPVLSLAPGEPALNGLVVLPGGRFYAVGGPSAAHPGAIYQINPTTGATSLYVEASRSSSTGDQIVLVPAQLLGTTERSTTGASVTFHNLRPSAFGLGYRLRFEAEGFQPLVSEPFDILAP